MLSYWKTPATKMYVDINEKHNTEKWQSLLMVIKYMRLVHVICPKLLLIMKLHILIAS